MVKEVTSKTPEEFAKEYNNLCEEYGLQVAASPQWVARDDGSFSLVVNMQVVEKPKA